jgi:hypothetical protein
MSRNTLAMLMTRTQGHGLGAAKEDTSGWLVASESPLWRGAKALPTYSYQRRNRVMNRRNRPVDHAAWHKSFCAAIPGVVVLPHEVERIGHRWDWSWATQVLPTIEATRVHPDTQTALDVITVGRCTWAPPWWADVTATEAAGIAAWVRYYRGEVRENTLDAAMITLWRDEDPDERKSRERVNLLGDSLSEAGRALLSAATQLWEGVYLRGITSANSAQSWRS